ncbi:hypothetical protein Y032_0002g942 [Ancylostoma ceylanicum]|uniref:Uncharacterized protein n=1 Tax=Ancylostoma ceylanicum TaxID=53326 RepID=A0A016W3Y6_9BILA|nr:hypothetical protein Y032_0002g942 [Ancylostoma ceylanicum]
MFGVHEQQTLGDALKTLSYDSPSTTKALKKKMAKRKIIMMTNVCTYKLLNQLSEMVVIFVARSRKNEYFRSEERQF